MRAPVYQNTQADEMGNDVRDGIYLPGGDDQIWIDYFTGQQYRGGQILNGYDAPLWKLPLFVKNGAIIPMYAEHNVAAEGVELLKALKTAWTRLSASLSSGRKARQTSARSRTTDLP